MNRILIQKREEGKKKVATDGDLDIRILKLNTGVPYPYFKGNKGIDLLPFTLDP